MGHHLGRVTEIRLETGGQREALIACPVEAIPHTGQYLLASNMDDPEEVLGVPLFLAEKSRHGFWSAPPIPAAWRPGMKLDLLRASWTWIYVTTGGSTPGIGRVG